MTKQEFYQSLPTMVKNGVMTPTAAVRLLRKSPSLILDETIYDKVDEDTMIDNSFILAAPEFLYSSKWQFAKDKPANFDKVRASLNSILNKIGFGE